MTPFSTARDISLSIWQSAVDRAMAGEMPAAPSTMGIVETPPEGSDREMMNLATGIYIAAADPQDDASEESAMRRNGFALGSHVNSITQSQAELSTLYHQLGEAIVDNNTMRQRLLSQQIQDHPGIGIFDWSKALEEFIKYYGRGKGEPHYRSWQAEGKGDMNYSVIDWKLPSSARVAIIADWGTGRTEAINVLKAACSLLPDAIIHLGDIYFSGLPEECRDNFFQIMRTYAVDEHGEPIPVFTMAGNHDYYSGGAGFLELIDMLNTGSKKQAASYFCLRSEDGGWQFLAMDTGHNDHIFSLRRLLNSTGPDLRPDEAEWHRHKLDDPAFTGRTILLSHHQAFSANDRIGDPDGHDRDSVNQRLIATFRDHLDKIPLWLWGHEHTMMVFDPFEGVQRGRCIGHGGVPISSSSDPYTKPRFKVPFRPEARLGTQGKWYNHGFAFLSLHGNGSPANVDYYQVIQENTPDGYSMTTSYRETIQ